jgi:hypothetical protein
MQLSLRTKTVIATGMAAFILCSSLLVSRGNIAQAHQDPIGCNASGLQQFPSVSPSTVVYDGDTLTYSVIYINSDPDGAGPVSPCNLSGLNATIDLPGPGGVVNVLTNATLNVGDSITCPGGAGCAAGPYTYTVTHADETLNSVTTNFHINGTLHQSDAENTASDDDNLSANVIHPSTLVNITSSAAQVVPGGTVTLTVTEQNDGDANLSTVSVAVDNGVGTLNSLSAGFSGDDGDSVLEPGETWQWIVNGVVINTTTTFTATGSGTDPLGNIITYPGDQQEQDSVTVTMIEISLEGCTPGYWKQSQHFDSWMGYTPTDLFATVFGESVTINYSDGGKPQPVTNPTLLQALGANGGGVNALARHAVAALLNSSNTNVDYPLTTAAVIGMVTDALPNGDIAGAHTTFATNNELGCPLN